MIERWEEQTFNERLQIGLQFGENIAQMFFKLRGKKAQTKTITRNSNGQKVTESYTESY